MAYITKCTASQCPSRALCLRWTAAPSERQSYALFRMSETEQRCSDFIPNSKDERAGSSPALPHLIRSPSVERPSSWSPDAVELGEG